MTTRNLYAVIFGVVVLAFLLVSLVGCPTGSFLNGGAADSVTIQSATHDTLLLVTYDTVRTVEPVTVTRYVRVPTSRETIIRTDTAIVEPVKIAVLDTMLQNGDSLLVGYRNFPQSWFVDHRPVADSSTSILERHETVIETIRTIETTIQDRRHITVGLGAGVGMNRDLQIQPSVGIYATYVLWGF